jgi:chromosome segregation ATPase
MTRRLGLLLAGLAGAAVQVGCATGYKRADQTSEMVGETGTRLDRESAQVDTVLEALEGVVSGKGGDLRAPYTKFSEEVDKTESAVASAQGRAADLRAAVDEHLKGWTEETKTISSAELKEASAARREKTKASSDKVGTEMEKVKAAADPFMKELNDLRVFLGNDLTSRGVEAAGPAIKKARSEGEDLKKAIKAAKESLEQLRAELASPVAPPPPPPAPAKPAETPAKEPSK